MKKLREDYDCGWVQFYFGIKIKAKNIILYSLIY